MLTRQYVQLYTALTATLESAASRRSRRGATMLEYMLLAAFGAVVAGLLFTVLRTPISNVINNIARGLGIR
jgi:Flp pilus assembly pilin Flp